MKPTLLFVIVTIFFSFGTVAQNKKYQSLLWEVSGNGLEKKSYLYGTMHVSDRISYHLSTAFFEKLLSVDIVATESDPLTWASVSNIYSTPIEHSESRFYSSFYLFPIEKKDLYPLFKGFNYNQNHLMARTNDRNINYQENTYLDMFIYRTGRKYGKKCVGLESSKEAAILIEKGRKDARNTEFIQNEQSISRLQKTKSNQELTQEYYREKDLDMLDSIMRLTTHPKILEGLLYNRNVVMVNSIDSLMKTGSLFAAVGASHLPGTKGVIEMLREKGYSVNPIFGDYTDEGRAIKKEIDTLFIKPELKIVSSNDGMIQLPLFESHSENKERIESADVVNGGYVNVKRISTNDFIRKSNYLFNHLTLDSLFFESIPGDIIEKKFYIENGIDVYDIKSITKTKNSERYRFYITPLEIITIIMGGEGDYVRQFESLIFDKISIKQPSNINNLFLPKKGGFEVQLPDYHKIIGDGDAGETYSDIQVVAFDKSKSNNFFLIERTLTDAVNLYNSSYELRRLANEFLFQIGADTINSFFDKNQRRYYTNASLDNRSIQLMSVLNGSKYYLLGAINTTNTESETYFNSFKLKQLSINAELITFKDTKAGFSIEIPKKYNEFLDLNVQGVEKEWGGKHKFNIFDDKRGRYTFYNPTGEIVELGYCVYGEYVQFQDREEFWKELITNITSDHTTAEDSLVNRNDYLENKRKSLNYDISRWSLDMEVAQNDFSKYTLIEKKLTPPDEDGTQLLNAVIVKDNCIQATRIKCVLTNNSFYYIRALVDKDRPDASDFVNHCFESLKIEGSTIQNSIFENKLDRFIQDVNSTEERIQYSAKISVDRLKIDAKQSKQLIDFLSTYRFKPDEVDVELELIVKLLEVDASAGIKLLEKLYSSENVLPSTQLFILRELASVKEKKMCQKIQELMEFDLPLVDNQREVFALFEVLKENKFSEVLFPDILQFYGVPEYNKAIINFTEFAIVNNIIQARSIKAYKKMILTNAKLEYKRLAAWIREQSLNDKNELEDYFGYNSRVQSAPIDRLLKYVHILEGFKNDKKVKELLSNLKNLNIDEYYLDILATQVKNNKQLDDVFINTLLAKETTKFPMYQALQHIGRLQNSTLYNEDSIAFTGISQLNNFSPTDSLTIFKKLDKEIGSSTIRYFFYRVLNSDDKSEGLKSERIVAIAFFVEDNKMNPQSYKNFRSRKVNDEDEINDFISVTIDESLHQNYRRAFTGKYRFNNRYEMFEDFYEDEYYEEEYYEE